MKDEKNSEPQIRGLVIRSAVGGGKTTAIVTLWRQDRINGEGSVLLVGSRGELKRITQVYGLNSRHHPWINTWDDVNKFRGLPRSTRFWIDGWDECPVEVRRWILNNAVLAGYTE